ncbi:flavin reductase family protein [Rhodococcus qingshengii]|uniref:flavin reductase family protein n=1 Tax=Rhodococcus qingshengii TaxID=334542 RepID=UPI001BEA4CC9|nr:flavin reductase family protein [Rhodococcus qingshengii]MBT2273565.1 flavin reductase [Rhodococcus qingshengii]
MLNEGDVPPSTKDSAFEQIVGALDYPMFVVTTRAGEWRAGCLVGFASQISIVPARFLVGLSNKNYTYRLAAVAEHVAVHLVSRRHGELATLFGEWSGDDIDKFERCDWRDGPFGLPILEDAAAWFAGRILEKVDMGDHVAFLLEPETGHAPEELGGIITFADVRELEPGHDA